MTPAIYFQVVQQKCYFKYVFVEKDKANVKL